MKTQWYRRGLGIGLLAASVGCASYAPVAITSDQAAVAGCAKVDDVSLPPDRGYDDSEKALVELARAKGANYLVVDKDDQSTRKGVAYRCATPAAGGGS